MAFQLNRQSFERMKSLVEDGKYTDKPWSFSAVDSNALLGNDNWTDYEKWFLGIDRSANLKSKDAYGHPYGKEGSVYLSALRAIAGNASGDIAKGASDVLAIAALKDADKAKASGSNDILGTACDKDLSFAAPVSIEAASADETGKPRPRRFNMVAYTGGKMNLRGWYQPVVIDLAGVQGMDKARPVLHDHDPSQRVGHTDSILVSSGQICAGGVISGASPLAKQICAEADDGFPWQASVGAKALNNEFVPDGSEAKANGQTFKGPINIVRRSLLGEISFVALGADDNTSARIAAHAARGFDMNFEKWLEAKGFTLASLSETQRNSLQAAFDAENKPPVEKPAEKPVQAKSDDDPAAIQAKAIADMRAAHVAEAKRLAAVDKIAKGFPEIAAKALEEGWDEQKTELEVLRASRVPDQTKRPPGFNVNVGAMPDMTAAQFDEVIAASACMSASMPESIALRGLPDKAKELATSPALRNKSYHGIMAMVAAANGIAFPVGSVDMPFIRRMWGINAHRDMDIRADGFATMSLSGITENILNKGMLQAYASVASVVPDIAYETDTNDFKQFKRYRMTASGDYQDVGEAGDLKSMSLQDETYANQVATKGAIVTLTRNILINDDMGALTQVPEIIGRKAALAREKLVFKTWLAALGTLFTVAHGNYLSGSTSVLSISAVTLAVKAFQEQKDANGDPISLEPDRMLVCPAMFGYATELYNKGGGAVASALDLPSASSGTSAAQTSKLRPAVNIHAGLYRPVLARYMSTAFGLTGSTDTGWALLTNPAGGMATISVGYLRGQRTPVIERGEAEFNTLGIALRSYYDLGVATWDYRTGVFSAGV